MLWISTQGSNIHTEECDSRLIQLCARNIKTAHHTDHKVNENKKTNLTVWIMVCYITCDEGTLQSMGYTTFQNMHFEKACTFAHFVLI